MNNLILAFMCLLLCGCNEFDASEAKVRKQTSSLKDECEKQTTLAMGFSEPKTDPCIAYWLSELVKQGRRY